MRTHTIPNKLLVCAGLSFLCLGGLAADAGADSLLSQQLQKDKYLTIEALRGEDMPFFKDDYMLPHEYTKTKIDAISLCANREMLQAEDPTSVFDQLACQQVQQDPNEPNVDREKALTEDPTHVKGQIDY